MLALQVNELLNGVVLRVVRKQKQARCVIESNVIIFVAGDVTQAERQHWLDRKIIIRHPVRLADVDVVVINTAHGDFECKLESPVGLSAAEFETGSTTGCKLGAEIPVGAGVPTASCAKRLATSEENKRTIAVAAQ